MTNIKMSVSVKRGAKTIWSRNIDAPRSELTKTALAVLAKFHRSYDDAWLEGATITLDLPGPEVG